MSSGAGLNLKFSKQYSLWVNHAPVKYNKKIRPNIGAQLIVHAGFYVEAMSTVTEVDMDYELSAYFRQVKKIF